MSGVLHSISNAIKSVVSGLGSVFGKPQSPGDPAQAAMPAIPPPVPAMLSPQGDVAAGAARSKNAKGAWGNLQSMFNPAAIAAANTDRKSLLG